jgi:AraC-like DNA-binding protein
MGMMRKTPRNWIRHAFETLNFSFILDGGGVYRRDGEVWEVKAPCVIMQWPGDELEYGPDSVHGFWQEFYLIYDAKRVPDFLAAGLTQPGEILRPLVTPSRLKTRIEEITTLVREEDRPGLADRIDVLCELLIIESLQGGERTPRPEVQAVQHIHRVLTAHLDQEVDVQKLARSQGMSYSNFRRIWAGLYHMPPRRYLISRRIEKACDALVNTSLSIGEIAIMVGFADPLYFSRSFRRETGMSATAYRQRYQSFFGEGAGANQERGSTHTAGATCDAAGKSSVCF